MYKNKFYKTLKFIKRINQSGQFCHELDVVVYYIIVLNLNNLAQCKMIYFFEPTLHDYTLSIS